MEAVVYVEPTKVLAAWDSTVGKLKAWVPAVLLEMGAEKAGVDEFAKAMNVDALLFVPIVKTILKDGAAARAARDVNFMKLILPAQYQHLEIPNHIAEKGFLYFDVFEGLLRDLEQ